MAGAGYRDWAAGNVPTAAQFDTFLQEQTVMVFASAAARDTALSTAKSEGMCAYLLDVNTMTVYSGAAWSTTGPVHGALTTWTPTVTQLGSVTVTNTYSVYTRSGRDVRLQFQLAVTGSGTAGNAVIIGGLPVSIVAANQIAGGCEIFDSSIPNRWTGLIRTASVTTFDLRSTSSSGTDNRLGIQSFTAGLAAGDTLTGFLSVEANADA